MKMNRLVLLTGLALAIGYTVAAGNGCCYKKTLAGTEYTLLESGSSEVTSTGCNTPGACIYQDTAGDRFCFKMGGTDVPTCGCTDVLLVRPDNPVAEIWSTDGAVPCSSAQLPDMPEAVGVGLRGAYVDNDATKTVYVCCGGPLPNRESCYTLDMTNPNEWEKKDFTHGTKFHSLTRIADGANNVLLATGGEESDGLSAQMVVMNSQGRWRKLLNGFRLETAVQKHCEVSNGTHIWVLGGITDSQQQGSKSVAMLDLDTYLNKGWVDAADIPKEVFDAACVYDKSQHKIFVAAGKDFYALRIADNVWETLSEVPDEIKGGQYSMAIVNDKVTLFGGIDASSSTKSSTVHAFDMGKWTAVGTLKSPFTNGNAIKLVP